MKSGKHTPEIADKRCADCTKIDMNEHEEGHEKPKYDMNNNR